MPSVFDFYKNLCYNIYNGRVLLYRTDKGTAAALVVAFSWKNTKNGEILVAAFLEVKYAEKRNKSSYNFLGMDPQNFFLSFAAVFDIIKKLCYNNYIGRVLL